MSEIIEFTFTHPHRYVKCYLKPDGRYDVFVDRILMKNSATEEWVKMFKRLMREEHVLG